MDKQTFASSAIWKIAEALSTKGIALVISIILARILLPQDYGIVTLTAVFINLSTILVQSGLGTALIRKDKLEEVDYNNGFMMGFVVAVICYFVFFFGAPIISSFYKAPMLTPVLRIQMLSLFLVAFGNIQTVIITREFRFKELCFANIIANSISGVAGVVMAYVGFGVWALVFYTLLRDGISNLVLFTRIKWHPGLHIDYTRMKSLLGFSIWVLIATMVDFIGNNYTSALLGKEYSLSELGLYSKGYQIPEMICLYTFGAISSVLLPTFSVYQNDKDALKRVVKRLVEMSCYIIFPMMVGLALISTRLVPFLFTDKWSACVPVFIFACVSFGVNPLRSINMQLIYALGNSKKCLLVESIRSFLLVVGITLCAIVFKSSIYGIAAVAAGVAIINIFITQLLVKKYIEYGFIEWMKDMAPTILLCLAMGAIVVLAGMIPAHRYVVMFIQIVAGGAVYLLLSVLTRNRSFLEVKNIIMERIRNRSRRACVEGDNE